MSEKRKNMVNQAVLEYLRSYGKSFSMDDLKRKIVEGGYSEQDFNEAAGALGMIQSEVKASSMPEVVERPSGRRWMRFAGITGIIFLVLSAILFLASFFISPVTSTYGIPLIVSIAMIVLVLITFVLSLFFLKGFARMGKYTSRLLRFSSIALIVLDIASVVLGVILVLVIFLYARSSIAGIEGGTVSLGAVSSAGAIGWMFLVTIGLAVIFFVVINVLFFVGLLISGKRVRFAKPAGILGIVLMAVGLIIGLYIFSNPFMLIGMMMSGSLTVMLRVMQILIYIVSLSVLLFETFALFDASGKFENSGY